MTAMTIIEIHQVLLICPRGPIAESASTVHDGREDLHGTAWYAAAVVLFPMYLIIASL